LVQLQPNLVKIAWVTKVLSDRLSAKDRGFASVQMKIFKIINIANDQAVIASKTTTFHDGMSIAPL
jgi:hypothetical protein